MNILIYFFQISIFELVLPLIINIFSYSSYKTLHFKEYYFTDDIW